MELLFTYLVLITAASDEALTMLPLNRGGVGCSPRRNSARYKPSVLTYTFITCFSAIHLINIFQCFATLDNYILQQTYAIFSFYKLMLFHPQYHNTFADSIYTFFKTHTFALFLNF